MTTSTATISVDNTSDTTFRAWGSAVSQCFSAVGLTKTADTGQVNWTTVVRPAASVMTVYEIWAFYDVLQATKPVYVKIWYFVNGNTVPQMQIQVGTVTDGAGNLTGSTTAVYTGRYYSAAFTSTTYCNVASDGSYLTAVIGAASGTVPWLMLSIDRTRNTDGTANGDGLYCVMGNTVSGTNPATGVVNTLTYGVLGLNRAWKQGTNATFPQDLPNTATGVAGTDVNIFPHIPYAPRPEGCLAILGMFWTDLAYGNTVSVTHLGAAHTYFSLGNAGQYLGTCDNGSCTQSHSALVRYE